MTANVQGQHVTVKGSKGELSFTCPDEVEVKVANDEIEDLIERVTARMEARD